MLRRLFRRCWRPEILRQTQRPVRRFGLRSDLTIAAAALLGGAGAVRCDETEISRLLRKAVEHSRPGMIAEIETGRAVLEQVNEVLYSHFGHLKLSSIDPMAVFFNVLEQTKLRTEAWKQQRALKLVGAMTDLEGDVVLFRDLLRYAKLADVAYATDEEALRKQLEALRWRFVTGSCDARPQRPAHFLAIQGKKVVLGVAGTHTIADCLTDCLCDSSPFQNGFAHRGAAEASTWLCAEYGESLKYLEEKGYEVVLVGHSLGAAVAAACCVQLRASGLAARCVCYAPPATVDQRSAREAANYITSVVHDDDVIPRMSILSLLELYKVVLSYNWLPAAKTLVAKIRGDPSSAWLLEMGDSAFGTLETQLEVAWKEQASHVVEELKKLETPRQQAQALSIPGFIVHLYRCPGGYGVMKALDTNFLSIELSSSMVTDHFLSGYISALETLTKAVEATHHSKLEWLRSRGGDGAEQVHEVAKKVEELVLKARSTLQARPDTS